MTDLKKQAKQARKQLNSLDLSSIRDYIPSDLDLHFIKKREDEAASKGFIGGFFLGALVGAILALIFYPSRDKETGNLVIAPAMMSDETRHKIVDTAKAAVEKVQHNGAEDVVDEAKDATEETTEKVKDAAS